MFTVYALLNDGRDIAFDMQLICFSALRNLVEYRLIVIPRAGLHTLLHCSLYHSHDTGVSLTLVKCGTMSHFTSLEIR